MTGVPITVLHPHPYHTWISDLIASPEKQSGTYRCVFWYCTLWQGVLNCSPHTRQPVMVPAIHTHPSTQGRPSSLRGRNSREQLELLPHWHCRVTRCSPQAARRRRPGRLWLPPPPPPPDTQNMPPSSIFLLKGITPFVVRVMDQNILCEIYCNKLYVRHLHTISYDWTYHYLIFMVSCVQWSLPVVVS